MPVSLNLLPDEVIARGVNVPDYGTAFTGYFAGQDQAQKQQLQNLFSGGLPRTPGGDIDYNQIAEQLARASGAGAIPTLTALRSADIQQQAIKGLESQGPAIFGSPLGQPQQPQQPRPQLPPSINRTSSLPTDQTDSGDERRLRPDQPGNLGEVTGVEYGQPSTSYAPEPPGDTRYPSQFSQAPDTGPPTGRFQVAQAQPAPQTPAARPAPPAMPEQPLAQPGSPGFFTEANAAAYETAARRAGYAATQLGIANMAPAAAAMERTGAQYSDTAKLIREQLGKAQEKRMEYDLKQQGVLPEAAGKANVSRLEKGQEKAEVLAQGAAVTQDLVDQLNSKSGIFAGAWAEQRLKLARIAEQIGYPIAPEQITSTQTFMALMGKRVAAGVKAFGSGTSITNQDREYVNKMEGGDISLDETSIRRILDINDKIGRETIKQHNSNLDRVIKASPNAAGQLEPFRVQMPPPIEGRMQQPKPGPAGVRPETFTGPSGRTYRVINGKLVE